MRVIRGFRFSSHAALWHYRCDSHEPAAEVFVADVTTGNRVDLPDHEEQSLLDQLRAISRASALEQMASGIAHELNQPLGAIVTFAQAGERIVKRPDSSPASVSDVFQLISKEALAAAEGISRMRRLFDRASFQMASNSMAEVLRELAPVLQLLGTQVGVPLRMDIQDNLCNVSIDRLRIQHVLLTLAQNAFEATRLADTGVRQSHVTIEARSDRYGVEISVIDSGRGVADEHRSKLFHPFFTTKVAGTGLGLTSARATIEAHQGTIGFEKMQNQRTRFWFRLPASEAGETA